MSFFDNVKDWAQTRSDLVLHSYEEVTSTNTIAKEIPSHKLIQLIIAKTQNSGRGRGNNIWISPAHGTALLSSWVFELDYAPQPILAPLVGLSVFKSLKIIGGLDNLWLKPPNDIYINNKKIGGILIEIISQGDHHRLIIGIGINVESPANLDISGSLNEFRKDNIDLCTSGGILEELFLQLKKSVEASKQKTLSLEQRKETLEAISSKNKIYDEILADGSLVSENEITPWFQL